MRILLVAALAALCALMVTGCASIVEGTTQTITVDVSPPTGTCIVSREGEQLGISTPERRGVTISKSKNDLLFTCSAPGFQTKTDNLASTLAPATVASFFLLDFGIVDAATGAWKKYPDRVGIILQPEAPPSPAPTASTAKKSHKKT